MRLLAILIDFSICLGILVATVMTLVLIGYVFGGVRARSVRVLMFSSIDEANHAARIARCELPESAVVTQPLCVPEIDRYFVVVEELTDERTGAGGWPDRVRSKSL
jgi:hypothetical protein